MQIAPIISAKTFCQQMTKKLDKNSCNSIKY